MMKSNEEAKVVTCDLRALKNEQGTVDLHIGEIEAKIVNGEFYSVHIHIPRQGTEYFKLDYTSSERNTSPHASRRSSTRSEARLQSEPSFPA